jgi:hypothetical protein
MKHIEVEGGVVKCELAGNTHWHAKVNFVGCEPVVSCACSTEEDAEETLAFAREVVQALVKAGGGMTYLSDGTEKVQ